MRFLSNAVEKEKGSAMPKAEVEVVEMRDQPTHRSSLFRYLPVVPELITWSGFTFAEDGKTGRKQTQHRQWAGLLPLHTAACGAAQPLCLLVGHFSLHSTRPHFSWHPRYVYLDITSLFTIEMNCLLRSVLMPKPISVPKPKPISVPNISDWSFPLASQKKRLKEKTKTSK